MTPAQKAEHPWGLTSAYNLYRDGRYHAVDAYTLRPVGFIPSTSTYAEIRAWIGEDWTEVTPED